MQNGLSLTDHDRYQDRRVAHQDQTVNSYVEDLIALLILRHFKSLKNDRWYVNEEYLKHRALADESIVTFLTRKSCHKLLFA